MKNQPDRDTLPPQPGWRLYEANTVKRLLPLLALPAGMACAPVVMADDFPDGQTLYKKSRYEQAFMAFQKSARAENPKAQHAPGILYLEGRGTQFMLAGMYYVGFGVEKNNAQAFYWTQKAASQDYQPSIRRLAELSQSLPERHGTEKTQEKQSGLK